MIRETLRVCHIVSGDLWAGAESQAYTLIVGLSRMSAIEVSAIVFNPGLLADRLAGAGVDVEVVSEKNHGPLGLTKSIRALLKQKNIKLIHTHGYKETFVGGIASAFCGDVIRVRTHHGRGVMNGGGKHFVAETVNRWIFTGRVIAVSRELKRFLVSKGIKTSTIDVIHNGVAIELVQPNRRAEDVKGELGLEENGLVIGTIGRMVDVKGHKYFVEGARRILKKRSDVVFIVVGDGPLMEDVRLQIEKAGISNNVKLLGFRPDVYDLLNICDVFCLTSIHEGLPMVLLEAMCLGKAVLATHVGGIPEVVTDRSNGLLIKPEDADDFAEACKELLDNEQLRKTLGANAAREVARKYSSDKVADKVAMLYRGLL